MLTINSNLKIKELDKLCNVLIKSDIINFNIKKVGGGFPKDLSTKIINKLNYKGTVLVINDLSLEMINELLEAGYKLEDITLAFGKWNNNGTVSDDKIMYNIIKDFIKYNIKEKLNVIFLGDIFMGIKHWDCIIANLPYGVIGANITYTIRKEIDYTEYVNLLPLKDYSLETGRYIDFTSIVTFAPHSFVDADTLTHAVRILPKANTSIKNLDELCAASFTVDKPMIKFMKANELKNHYAISNIRKFGKDCDVKKTFVFHHFDTGSAHTSGLPKITSNIPKNNYNFKNEDTSVDGILYGVDKAIRFSTELEKQRFVNIIKVARNFINRLIANQFIAIRDTAVCFPKIDLLNDKWDVSNITTEEKAITLILKEVANYTDDEIKAVLDTMNVDYFISDDDSIKRIFGRYL